MLTILRFFSVFALVLSLITAPAFAQTAVPRDADKVQFEVVQIQELFSMLQRIARSKNRYEARAATLHIRGMLSDLSKNELFIQMIEESMPGIGANPTNAFAQLAGLSLTADELETLKLRFPQMLAVWLNSGYVFRWAYEGLHEPKRSYKLTRLQTAIAVPTIAFAALATNGVAYFAYPVFQTWRMRKSWATPAVLMGLGIEDLVKAASCEASLLEIEPAS